VQSCHQGKGWRHWGISNIKYILICLTLFLVKWFHVLFHSFDVFTNIQQCRIKSVYLSCGWIQQV
jgi:hypothetical protein